MPSYTASLATDISTQGKSAVGWNLGGISYFREPVYLNRIKQSQLRTLAYGYEDEMVQDANGWPTAPASGEDGYRIGLCDNAGADRAYWGGTFALTWTGAATISGFGTATVSNNSATSCTVALDTRTDQLGQLTVTPVSWADHPRDVVMVKTHDHLGNPVDHVARHAAGELFDPDWLANLAARNPSHIRFMNWGETNRSPVVDWSDYMPENWYRWTQTPVSVMCALANELGCNPWFCIPHQATDAFVTTYATVVRDNLDSNLVPFFEYSNECWNWGFSQANYCLQQAVLAYGTDGNQGEHADWYGQRSAGIFQIVNSVFGARPTYRVLAWKRNSSEEDFLTSPRWQTADPGAYVAPHSLATHYACTTYFGNSIPGDHGNTLAADMAANGQASAVAMVVGSGGDPSGSMANAEANGTIADIQARASMIASYGLRMISYESNQHIELQDGSETNLWSGGDPTPEALDLCEAINYSPEMGVLHGRVMDAWRAAGGEEITMFNDINPHTKNGSWGIRRYVGDENPVAQAIDAWRVANPRTWLR